MQRSNRIGEYLRARREEIYADDLGVARVAGRRAIGLHPDEVAKLAGINPDAYLRIEDGRDRYPAPEVLDALARVLHVDNEGYAYLVRLVKDGPGRRRLRAERVPRGVQGLVASWTTTAAYVHDQRMNVLLANPLARALSRIFSPRVNLVRAAFLEPAVRELYRDWEAFTINAVAGLRAPAGPGPSDPWVAELVDELSHRSEHFRRLWTRRDLRQSAGGTAFLDHPKAGAIELHSEQFAIAAKSQVLVICYADPGSPSARSLAWLAERAVAERPTARSSS